MKPIKDPICISIWDSARDHSIKNVNNFNWDYVYGNTINPNITSIMNDILDSIADLIDKKVMKG